MADQLKIAGKQFSSRLFLGTGKYASPEQTIAALDASGTQLVTVAIRRLDLDNPNARTELDYIDWERYNVLPNTAGSSTVEEALFTARLGRSVTNSNWVKLEVIPDPKYLLPDPIGTLRAAETLIAEGFVVLPYIHADPVLAKHLEEAGCATVMPLGSAIGSGQGILTLEEIRIIIENARVPVVVDAGIGAPSDAALAMEIGADAVLVNTAVAKAADPPLMAAAMKKAVEAGREAFLAGRIASKRFASASSPLEGVPAQTEVARMVAERRARLRFPALMFVTDTSRRPPLEATGEEWLDDIVREAVLGGVTMVQLREKQLSQVELVELGLHVRDAIAQRALFFVNSDVDAAITLDADGIHLPEAASSVRDVRGRVGEEMLISRAVHSVDAAVRAEREGADMLIAGTVFRTPSKPSTPILGTDGLRDVCAAVQLPVIAIGGINAENAAEALAAGAKGVAVVDAIAGARDPRKAATELRLAIDAASMRGVA